ncbi:hypothetical protein D3C85_1625530 [compost metagenome]
MARWLEAFSSNKVLKYRMFDSEIGDLCGTRATSPRYFAPSSRPIRYSSESWPCSALTLMMRPFSKVMEKPSIIFPP